MGWKSAEREEGTQKVDDRVSGFIFCEYRVRAGGQSWAVTARVYLVLCSSQFGAVRVWCGCCCCVIVLHESTRNMSLALSGLTPAFLSISG